MKKDIDLEVLSSNLCRLMAKNKLSEVELSRKSGIPQPHLNRLKKGLIVNPGIDALIKLSKYFDVTIDQLIGAKAIEKLYPNEETKQAIKTIKLPIISWSTAMHYNEDDQSTLEYLDVANENISPGCFCLKTKPSHKIRFPLESLLIIDVNAVPSDCSMIIAQFSNTSEAGLFEYRIEGPTAQLCSVPSGEMYEVTTSVKIIGVAVSSVTHL